MMMAHKDRLEPPTQHRTTQEKRLIGALLRVPYLAVTRRVYAGLIGAGFDDLRPAHLTVFQHIDADVGSTLTWLAEQAQLTKQSMGYLIDHLEAQGYVARAADPGDSRSKLIRLTPRGVAVMTTARQIVHGIEQEWAHVIGQADMNHLRAILQHLVTHLERDTS